MKVKHIKRTRTVLREFMQKATEQDQSKTLNMCDSEACAWFAVTGCKWDLGQIYDYFYLTKGVGLGYYLKESLAGAVTDLFCADDEAFTNTEKVTWEEWLAAAEVVEARLTLAIKKLKLEKVKKKYAK